MTGRTAHETWNSRVGHPLGPACRRAPNSGGSPLVQRKQSLGHGLRVGRVAFCREIYVESNSYVGFCALQSRRSGSDFALDSCRYRA